MSLAIAADVLKAPRVGADVVFTGVGSDTRTLNRGDLFVALKGPNYDGIGFLAEAINAGAVAALIHREIVTPLPYIKVDDTRRAMGELAAFWRRQFTLPVIAVTGSNGKSTVKEMLAAILGGIGSGCVTRGNLNNDIGVPLTLFRMRQNDRYAVIEMGMNHRGEIDYLTRMTRPTVALITNAAEAHLEGVGTVADVARTKGEIFTGLAPDGTAVINADDAYAGLWRELAARHRRLTFALRGKADVTAETTPVETGYDLHLRTPEGEADMRLPLLGRHNILNALAAAATAQAAGASLDNIADGLRKLRALSGRLEVKEGINGARIIDDTYNANPASLIAGMEVLKDFGGERVLVLGDMAELGAAAKQIHQRAGETAKKMHINRLFTLGELSAQAVLGFGKGGKHFTNYQAVIEALHDCLHGDMTVLVKGSRIMRMERVVAGIVKQNGLSRGRGGARKNREHS